MKKEKFGNKKRGRPPMPTFIDLFGGCGGLSLGLMEAGWKGLFSIEKESMAFETLKYNLARKSGKNYFRWPKWLEKKPYEISGFNKQHKRDLRRLRGKVDMVAGGPPCQGFSFAGKRRKRDPRNQLFKEYIRCLKLVRPKICLIENVPGINIGLGKEKALSNGRPKQDLPTSYSKHIKRYLEKLKYRVVFNGTIRAIDCGVPQYRPRHFIIGIQKNLSKHITEESILDLIEQSKNQIFRSLELGHKFPVTVKHAISDLTIKDKKLEKYENWPGFKQIVYEGPITKYQEYLHTDRKGASMNGNPLNSLRLPNHEKKTVDRFRKIKALCRSGDCRIGVSILKKTLESLGTKKNTMVLLDARKPSHTLTTLPDDILHYSEPRVLTVREYARLQSFPDWFEFKGNYTTGGKRRAQECPRYTQVANAVPPLMAEVIGQVLLNILKNKYGR